MNQPEKVSEDDRRFVRGVRVAAKKLARKLVPAMPVPEPEDNQVKRDAYHLAIANRHKPWARRYLRALKPGVFFHE